ncbi:MAG: hypothetical protein SRB1_01339 [Desulfobacteraceae bacterium Eth-SRB1]|nr:MAG: hypothetical protein SRB1_01339 [Desulfobacteraceae bacterium Eth-SRB1]
MKGRRLQTIRNGGANTYVNIQVSSKLLEKYLGAKLAYYSQNKRLSGTGRLPAYEGGNV